MPKIIVRCKFCGKEFEREKKQVTRSKKLGSKIFCSVSCSSKYAWKQGSYEFHREKTQTPEELKEWKRQWYKRNKKRIIKKSAIRSEKIRKEMYQFLDDYKENHGCKICEETEPCCLVFHHLNPQEKDLSISMAVRKGWGKARLQKEIDKCVVLCANCHRKLHAGVTQLVEVEDSKPLS